jgi:aspartate kinase
VSHTKKTDIPSPVPKTSATKAMKVARGSRIELSAADVILDDDIARVAIVGIGMKSHPGVAASDVSTLAENKINIEMISTSDISISCVIEKKFAETAVKTLHKNFNLGLAPGPGRTGSYMKIHEKDRNLRHNSAGRQPGRRYSVFAAG